MSRTVARCAIPPSADWRHSLATGRGRVGDSITRRIVPFWRWIACPERPLARRRLGPHTYTTMYAPPAKSHGFARRAPACQITIQACDEDLRLRRSLCGIRPQRVEWPLPTPSLPSCSNLIRRQLSLPSLAFRWLGDLPATWLQTAESCSTFGVAGADSVLWGVCVVPRL